MSTKQISRQLDVPYNHVSGIVANGVRRGRFVKVQDSNKWAITEALADIYARCFHCNRVEKAVTLIIDKENYCIDCYNSQGSWKR